MLDIRAIRENPEHVQEALKKRGFEIDFGPVLEIDERRRTMRQKVEGLRARQNAISEEIAHAAPAARDQKIKESRILKEELQGLEDQFRELEEGFASMMSQFPNIPLEEVPAGDESDNVVLRSWGEIPQFDFPVKDHLEIGEALDLIDVQRASKVAGSRFAYLKNEAALLEFALVRFVMEMALSERFSPIIPPVLIRSEVMQNMGYVDTPEDLAERYYLERDGLFLVGTAEQAVGPMHAGETFEESDLPKRYVAFSTCFREEAGSYGKDTKGILRVHQFDKAELFSFCSPQHSRSEHEFLIAFEERLWQALGIPYRTVQLAAGDMSRPAASTVDIEAWMPGQGKYREVSSASNTTDFQARRLNIRYRNAQGEVDFVHMLNATGLPIGRTLIAIFENYQQKDGSILVPEALRPFLGKNNIG